MNAVLCEVCVDTPAAAVAAAAAGADRIELCAGLALGGLTPSAGALRTVRDLVAIEIVALVRPRRGDFLYDEPEMRAMLADVRVARELGADGVAVGMLLAGGEVDREGVARLVEAAGELPITFHRAFDHARDPHDALESIIELGCARILTSGQAPRAGEGTELLRELVEASGGRIRIMPGGGIRPDDVAAIVTATGVRDVHFSASVRRASKMTHRPAAVDVTPGALPGDDTLVTTTAEAVQAYVSEVRALSL